MSTFGLMPDRPKRAVIAWADQLVDQEMLAREGDFNILKVTPKGWEVLGGRAEAVLRDPGTEGRSGKKRTRRPADEVRPLAGERHAGAAPSEVPPAAERPDPHARVLFEKLKALRRTIATERGVPAFMVFSDKTLREMARVRPKTRDAMLEVYGVGPAKYRTFGQRFMDAIRPQGDIGDGSGPLKGRGQRMR